MDFKAIKKKCTECDVVFSPELSFCKECDPSCYQYCKLNKIYVVER